MYGKERGKMRREKRLNDATPAEWDQAYRHTRHTKLLEEIVEEYRAKAVNSKEPNDLYVSTLVVSELQKVLNELKLK